MSQIEIQNVTKRYGKKTALQSVTCTLQENKIYGLLGQNGAGKTTLLRILSNRLFPQEGAVYVDGEPVLENDRALRKLFYMSNCNLYPSSGRVDDLFCQTKVFYPGFDLPLARRLAGRFGLDLKARIRSLSTGYSTIFRLLIALCCNAPVVLYDEPVLGLDASHRALFYREFLAHYAETPQTVVFSTHLIDEVAGLLEEVILLHEGKILLCQNAEELLDSGYTVVGPERLVDPYVQGRNVIGAERLGPMKAVHLLEKREDASMPAGLEWSRLSLQSIYIHLTNQEREGLS